MNLSFVFKLYFSSTFNYAQLSYKLLSCIHQSRSTSKLVVTCVSSRMHAKKWSKGREKACAIGEMARPKRCLSNHSRKKWTLSPKN